MPNIGLPGEIARHSALDQRGGLVAAVEPGSPAERAGLRAGDVVIDVAGHRLRDVLDYQFYTAEERVELRVARDGTVFGVTLPGYGDLGLRFGAATFDGIRRCKNRCPFCFLKQLPKGLRRSLYIKDDDYRYSVGYGGFVTLSNLTDADWQRLAEQRLSPLRVSVHATDLSLRRQLLGNPNAPDVLDQLRRLRDLGLQAHTQLVLCPGINDGDHLARSVSDLAALYPTVQSIAAVPVGLTNLSLQRELRGFSGAEALAVVDQVRRWQRYFRNRLGVSLVYLADELYFLAGRPFPAGSRYDGYPQYENGVGMVRSLLDEASRLRRRGARGVPSLRVTLACGTRIAPLLSSIAREIGPARIDVVAVGNIFFGSGVNVSGLLTGADVCSTLAGRDLGDLVVLPRAMLDAAGERCLDEATPDEVEARLGRPVRFAATLRQLLQILRNAPKLEMKELSARG